MLLNWLPLAVTILIGAATIYWLRRQTQTDEDGEARDEALSLAKIRAERNSELVRVNDELNAKIKAVADKGARDQSLLNLRIAELEHGLERQREEAEHAQNLLLTGFRAVLAKSLRYLTTEPPEIASAISFLRENMNGVESDH